jgi:hypothetical protein
MTHHHFELSLDYLPENSDDSIEIPRLAAQRSGLLDATLHALEGDSLGEGSFQIPIAAESTNLLTDYSFLGLNQSQIMVTPRKRSVDSLSIGQLTPLSHTSEANVAMDVSPVATLRHQAFQGHEKSEAAISSFYKESVPPALSSLPNVPSQTEERSPAKLQQSTDTTATKPTFLKYDENTPVEHLLKAESEDFAGPETNANEVLATHERENDTTTPPLLRRSPRKRKPVSTCLSLAECLLMLPVDSDQCGYHQAS